MFAYSCCKRIAAKFGKILFAVLFGSKLLRAVITLLLIVQGDTLDFDPYLARYCDIVETRGLFYWNPHATLGWKHIR